MTPEESDALVEGTRYRVEIGWPNMITFVGTLVGRGCVHDGTAYVDAPIFELEAGNRVGFGSPATYLPRVSSIRRADPLRPD